MKNKILLCIIAVMVAACATQPPVPEHTLLLGEVVQLSTSQEARGGLDNAGSFERFPDQLSSECGVSNTGPDVYNLALVRFSYYWHNGGARARETVIWNPVLTGLTVAPGNVVEIEFLAGSGNLNSRCPWVSRILADDIASAGCQYRQTEQGALNQTFNLFTPIGGPGSASLDCPALVASGWKTIHLGHYGAVAYTHAPKRDE